MAAAVDQEKKDAADGWQIVRSTRPTDSGRRNESVGVVGEGQRSTESVGVVGLEKKESLLNDDQATNYQHLIGAAIRKNDTDRSETGVTKEPEIQSRIGGLLILPPGPGVPSKSRPYQERLDLNNTSEWPSVGWEKDTVPRLTSWNAVVKKPPVPKQPPLPKESEVEQVPAHGERDMPPPGVLPKSRKKKKKGSDSADVSSKRDPLTFEFAAVFQALELTQAKKVVLATGGGVALPKRSKVPATTEPGAQQRLGNALDSSAPTMRRGKERETPKKKRPSALRKVIVKEKEDRVRTSSAERNGTEQDGGARVESSLPQQPITTNKPPTIHNRRYREYCDHLLSDEINTHVEHLLNDLRHFQDRQFLKDPNKAKTKRRYVCGLREVVKHLSLKKIKCVILPPNLDKIQSEGGINDFVEQIMTLCAEQSVPVVFAMTRRRLAVLLRKKHQIGCVGIFFYDGAEKHYKSLMEAVDQARAGYSDKVAALKTSTSASTVAEGNTATADQGVLSDGGTSTAAGELGASLLQTLCHSTSPSGAEAGTTQQAFSLNIDASEFVPSSHSLNVNATIFTPSCSYGEL